MSDKVKIERFTGKEEDWIDWKREFRGAMLVKGLGAYLEGLPESKIIDEKSGQTNEEEIKEKNAKLFAHLVYNLNKQSSQMIDIQTPNNGVDAWHLLVNT